MKPKRLISLLVAVCMMITMLPLSAVTAFAADTSSSTGTAIVDGYKYAYTVNAGGKTATITRLLGPVDSEGEVDFANKNPYNITIPTELNGIRVTGIGNLAFSNLSALTNVTIPQGITSIGDYAFCACDWLISATIEEGVQSTGANMFNNCDRLATVKLPESLTTIADGSFANCSALNHVTIPDNVTKIGTSAFCLCNELSDITLGRGLTTIGNFAFKNCDKLETIQLPSNLKEIGIEAFRECDILKSITLPDSVTDIGEDAFSTCPELESITIPENVTVIKSGTFDYCSKLKSITLPAGLTSFEDDLTGCPAGYFRATDYKKDENDKPIYGEDGRPIFIYTPDGAIYYNNYKTAADALLANSTNTDLKNRNFLYLCNVTFDANGGTLTDKGGNPTDHAVVSAYKTQKINADDLKAIPNPTRAGYNFTGWYTKDGTSLNVNEITTKDMTEDITFYAHWEPAPKAPVCHPLTLKDGVITSVTVSGKDGADPEDITEIVKKNANEDGSFNVPEGATVSVAFDKDAFADSGLKFGHWDITGLDDPNAYQNKESFDFEMPAKAVTLKAMTQDASIEDDEPDIVGPIVIGTTVVVGGAVLGYQAYSLGAEFAGKLMALPYFPSNRSALAMMLWEDAGKPMPESELLYPDVGQEEQDMDLQHAARWAMENELIPDLNDEGTAPEEMKFYPDNAVSKIDVLNAWQKAQELKNN